MAVAARWSISDARGIDGRRTVPHILVMVTDTTAVPASSVTLPAFDDHGLRWVVMHDGTAGAPAVTIPAANFGTWGQVKQAVDWLTKTGCQGILVVDRSL